MIRADHPDDERLAALADHDPEAAADPALASHVADCARCAEVVSDLGVLRASLAELPDVAPPRPLRLVPDAEFEPAVGDRLGGWVRRFFTPLVTAGAALALVGAVGTAVPAIDGMASGSAGEPAMEMQRDAADGGDTGTAAEPLSSAADQGEGGAEAFGAGGAEDDALTTLPAERSPWPMVLFTGVALVAGILLLRWILVPRAG